MSELRGADAAELAFRIDIALGRKHMNRLGVAALQNLIDLAEREALEEAQPPDTATR